MSSVNWLLDDYGVRVVFSTLCIPDNRDPIARNVACVVLANGEVVDVEWQHEHQDYLIRRVDQCYENEFVRSTKQTPPRLCEPFAFGHRRHGMRNRNRTSLGLKTLRRHRIRA